VEARAPDGRRLSITRQGGGWSVAIQSSPRSGMETRGSDLAGLLSAATGGSTQSAWIQDLVARAEREVWKPLRWRA
jgi:hypothetical protein